MNPPSSSEEEEEEDFVAPSKYQHIFAISLWSNNDLERRRIADFTTQFPHAAWEEYGVAVVESHNCLGLVAARSFRDLEPLCPYSNIIYELESNIYPQSDFKLLKLRDGRYCDGNSAL